MAEEHCLEVSKRGSCPLLAQVHASESRRRTWPEPTHRCLANDLDHTNLYYTSRIGARMPARCFEYSCTPHPYPAELGQPPLCPNNHGPVLGSLPLFHMHRSVAFNSLRFSGPDNAANRAWCASPCSSVHRVSLRCRRSTSRARPQPMEPSPNRTRIAVSLRMRMVPPCASYVYRSPWCSGWLMM